MKKQVTAKALEHKDVRGKVLWYVIVSNGAEEYVINVGEKTYKAVHELENGKAEQLKIDDNKDKGNK